MCVVSCFLIDFWCFCCKQTSYVLYNYQSMCCMFYGPGRLKDSDYCVGISSIEQPPLGVMQPKDIGLSVSPEYNLNFGKTFN